MDLYECEIIDELDFRELEQIPQVTVKLTEGQILDNFMLEEEDIDSQERNKNVDLPNKQEIDREMVVWPNMSVETSCEQEECLEMKTCNVSLPKLFKAKESVHINEVELGVPKVDEMEIREKTRLPLKPPRICSSFDRERIGLEKEYLLNTVLNHRPPPEPPPKRFRVQSNIMDKRNLKWENDMLNISYFTDQRC